MQVTGKEIQIKGLQILQSLLEGAKMLIIIIIISLTSIFFQDKSRVWTAASQQH